MQMSVKTSHCCFEKNREITYEEHEAKCLVLHFCIENNVNTQCSSTTDICIFQFPYLAWSTK